jgi:NAD(P)H-dependent FMN reductase
MAKIAIIVGSTRPGRFGPQVAEWFHGLTKNEHGGVFDIIDIADFSLPILDEPIPSGISKDHTKRWSEAIAQYDGYVYVTPEYNHSLPGSFKNAVDFLSHEWSHKPVAYVGYGWAKGHRAIEAWRTVAAQFSQYDLREEVNIQLDGSGTFVPNDFDTSHAEALIKSIVFWAEELAPIRQKLNAA